MNLYRDLVDLPGRDLWPAFIRSTYKKHRPYFDGLVETYGSEVFGPAGLRGAVEAAGPAAVAAIRALLARGESPEATAEALLQQCQPLLPGEPPELYLATLLFLAPAATLCVAGAPVIAVGLERFTTGDPPPPPPGYPGRFHYRLPELEEMIPHEACHVARMRALSLPTTPRRLSLKDMVFLEGTALVFADHLVGRETLRTFLPEATFVSHRSHDQEVRRKAMAEFDQTGMGVFGRYFSPLAPVSGYYVGFSLCREYLERFGEDRLPELITMPSDEILSRLGLDGA